MAVKIEGLDEVLAKMKELPRSIQRSGARAAATRAMRIVRNDARKRARKLDDKQTPAKIWENIVTQYDSKKSKKEGGVVVKVGVLGGAKTGSTMTFKSTKKNKERGLDGQSFSVAHWRFLEFGTEKMAAHPFMRPALESNVEAVTGKFVAELSVQLDKAVARAAKRAARVAVPPPDTDIGGSE